MQEMYKLIIDGMTALHFGAQIRISVEGSVEIKKYCRSKTGNIALDVARSYWNEQIVELLKSHYNIEMLISFIN